MSTNPSREAYDGDVVGTGSAQSLSIEGVEYATIGWEGDDEILDLGTSGSDDDEDGATLVKVTLYRGKQPGVEIKPGLAQGHQIVAFLMGPLLFVPSKGKRVVVTWPQKTPNAPALILGTVVATPTAQFKADRAILDVGADHTLTLKGKNVLLLDHTGDEAGKFSAWMCVGMAPGQAAPGFYVSDGKGGGITIGAGAAGMYVGDGNGGVDAALSLVGTVEPTSSKRGVKLIYNNSGFITIDTSGKIGFSGRKGVLGFGTVTIGVGAGPAQPALWGFSGVMGVPSTSVFLST